MRFPFLRRSPAIRVLRILNAAALAMPGLVSSAARADLNCGDADGDGATALPDVILSLRFAVGTGAPAADQLLRIDLDGDGTIGIAEVTRMLRKVVDPETALTGCGGRIPSGAIAGERKIVYDGPIAAWARTAPDDTVTEVGVTLSMTMIENAAKRNGGLVTSPRFPDIARETTFFDHLGVWWERYGHGPDRFMAPHFDFHFHALPLETVLKINCGDLSLPEPDRTPEGYEWEPPHLGCGPKMGMHAVPISEAGATGFDKTMLVGSYAGEMTFLEPMITRQFLMKREDFDMEVPAAPLHLGRATRYPSRFRALFDEEADAYHFVFDEFVTAQ